MTDVYSIGEMVIDFIPGSEPASYIRKAGGAPANVAIAVAKNGLEASMCCKVGDDDFGHFLMKTLDEYHVKAACPKLCEEAITTMAFVSLAENGERVFTFARKPGADMMLREEEVDYDVIRQAKIFHFGTLSMTDEPVRSATKKALEVAKEAGCLISLDPNLRPPLWKSLDEAKKMMEYGFRYCDILKISDNEIQFVSGKEDYDEGIAAIRESYKIPLIFLTMGKDGSRAYYKDMRVEAGPFPQKNTIETTGAGDTFTGCALDGILTAGLDNLTEKDLSGILTFANAAAALITTRRGALKVMPEKEEVLRLAAERTGV